MRAVVRLALAAVSAVSLFMVVAVGVGRLRFARQVAKESEVLLGASADCDPKPLTQDGLRTLPDPVQRWLRWAGVVGKPLPTTVRLSQEGQLRQSERRPWLPFTADEIFTTNPPGFIWKATMRMAPGISIVGRDAYIGGRGSIDMRLCGLLPVARASGPELDQGALLRYLNETVWFPAAAATPYISWEPIDAHSARAVMRVEGVKAEATFVFDDAGRPVDMIAERYDLGTGRIETWSTPLEPYGEFAGVRVPIAGKAVWRYDSGDFAYIALRVVDVQFSFGSG